MRSYGTTFACALALISSISAASLPLESVGDLVSSITSADSVVPTEVVDSVTTGISEGAAATTGVVSKVASAVSSAASDGSLPTGVVSSVVGSATSVVSDSFPTDIFSSILDLTTLSCKYGNTVVSGLTNLVELSVSQATSAPTCFTSSSLTGSYILIMIDPDATNPQTLHYMQPGMISGSNSTSKNSSSSVTLSASESPAVKYAGPAPPISSGLHRYTFFLFSQPEDFALSAKFDTSDRTGFDIVSFAAEYGLGLPVAATFFVAENLTGNLTSGLTANGTLLGNGTLYGNSTRLGSSFNGTTILDSLRGNSTNGTLHGSSLHGNSTSSGNSTISSGGRNGNSTSGGNSTTSSSSSSSSSKDGSDSSSSSTGPVPISPTAAADSSTIGADSNVSTGGSASILANFALAGFVGMVTVGVTFL